MDELIKRANQDEETANEPEPENEDTSGDIDILQPTDEEETTSNTEETTTEKTQEPETDPNGRGTKTSQDAPKDTKEPEAEPPDTSDETAIETLGGTEETSTGEQPETAETAPEDSLGQGNTIEDEKIDKLKESARDQDEDEQNPYKASRKRFKALKQKEKEQFLKRDQEKGQQSSSDSLKDKYDSYGDGNVLH